jgi:glucose-6-phosphate isomerase
MLSVDLGNIFLDSSQLGPLLEGIEGREEPQFSCYKENFNAIKRAMGQYRKYSRLVVIGNGGSMNSFMAFYEALKHRIRMPVATLSTNEPHAIKEVRRKFPNRSTLVISVSKSGTNVQQLETTLAFQDYNGVAITEDPNKALGQLAKAKKWKIIRHPPISGRYAGFTSCSYAALMFAGIDVRKIDKGAKSMFKRCRPLVGIDENPALRLSTALFVLEHQGYTEVFIPVYSTQLAGSLQLVVQLMHESVCKEGAGQTFYGAIGPEMQHHTTQRFFGGKKNVVGVFVRVKGFGEKGIIRVPREVRNAELRDGKLSDLDKRPYEQALQFELTGVKEHAIHAKIPFGVITVDRVDEHSIGEFIGFWCYMAVYSSWLRNVNAFDQPEVEFSKKVSWELRRQRKQ